MRYARAYLLDLIEKHWKDNLPLDFIKGEIEKYHYSPRTTERRRYFIKNQLLNGFIFLFLFPCFILSYELYSYPQEISTILPVSFLIVYYIIESIKFSRRENLGMPSERNFKKDLESPRTEKKAEQRMQERREHLDRLFEIALVLLGILSAAEFQYFLTVDTGRIYGYTLKVFTVPFLVLIVFWLVKELNRDLVRQNITMLLTEFCWYFLSSTLFYYLLIVYYDKPIGIGCAFVISMTMSIVVSLAYMRTSSGEIGTDLHAYYKKNRWRGLRFLAFIGAYILLLIIVLPPI